MRRKLSQNSVISCVALVLSLGMASAARDEPSAITQKEHQLGARKEQQAIGNSTSSGGLLSDAALALAGEGPATARDIRWARLAFELMKETDCRQGQYTTERECRRFARVEMSQVSIFCQMSNIPCPCVTVFLNKNNNYNITA